MQFPEWLFIVSPLCYKSFYYANFILHLLVLYYVAVVVRAADGEVALHRGAQHQVDRAAQGQPAQTQNTSLSGWVYRLTAILSILTIYL